MAHGGGYRQGPGSLLCMSEAFILGLPGRVEWSEPPRVLFPLVHPVTVKVTA